jgi:hypothetical protein
LRAGRSAAKLLDAATNAANPAAAAVELKLRAERQLRVADSNLMFIFVYICFRELCFFRLYSTSIRVFVVMHQKYVLLFVHASAFLELLAHVLSRTHAAAFPSVSSRIISTTDSSLANHECTHACCRTHTLSRRFESDIAAYRGDDPLDLWRRYVKWVQESYPSGMHTRAHHVLRFGGDSNLFELQIFHFCNALNVETFLPSTLTLFPMFCVRQEVWSLISDVISFDCLS